MNGSSIKLSLAEYSALQNLLVHIAHSNCEKDLNLTEVADRFTDNALATVLRAVLKDND